MKKIIAFHGMGLNGNIMKDTLGELHTDLSEFIEVIYLNGFREQNPEELMPPTIAVPEAALKWGDLYYNMNSTVERVAEIIEADQNIIGIMGFSMGAGVLEHVLQKKLKQIKFVIIFSSSLFWREKHQYDSQRINDIPALLTIGTRDPCQGPSWVYTNQFINPTIIIADISHRIPKFDASQRRQIVKFVKTSMQQARL